MDAAAMSFVLDREGHKNILRVATNQELEMRNTQLEAQNEAPAHNGPTTSFRDRRPDQVVGENMAVA